MKEGADMGEETMTLEEQKQIAIDYYVNLMRIKAQQTSENKELDRQIEIAKLKLSTFSLDFAKLEKLF
ncbi:MAG: hypothetical protein LUD12_14005 [Lachnospiraceae bacterium]|nr:hypothetical protein [Lachnospiraceae bacterium]